MFHEKDIPYHFFDSASIAITIIQENKFLFVNKQSELMTGYSAAELVSKDIAEIIHPEDKAFVRSRHIQRMNGENVPSSYEFRIIHKSGKCCWLEIKTSLIQTENGPGVLCFFSDVSERKFAEEALRNREAILKSIFEVSDVGILVVRNRIIMKVNSAFCKMTGYSEKELVPQSTAMLFPDQKAFLQAGELLYSTGGIFKTELVLRKKNGTLFDVRLSSSRLDHDDVGAGICVNVMDISEYKRMQAKLATSEKRFRDMCDFLPQIVYEAGDDGIITYVNNQGYRYFGFSQEDFAAGIPVLSLIGEEDFVRVRDAAMDAKLNKTGLSIEFNAVRKDGSTFPVLAFMEPIRQENGVMEYRNLLVDVTPQKRLELQRTEAMQMMHDIIEFLPDPTFVIDNARKVVAWNKAIEALTGIKKEAILGYGDYAYAIPFYKKARPILIDLVFESNGGTEEEYDFVHRIGNNLFAEVFIPHHNQGRGVYLWGCACPLYDRNGAKTGAIESIRDITDIKNAEVLLRKSEARYRGIFETSFEGIFQTSVGGIFTEVNTSFVEILGYRSVREVIEVIRMDSPDFIMDAADRADINNRMASDGKIVGREVRLLKKNRDPLWARLSIVAVKNASGQIESFNGVMVNISERKSAEHAQKILHDLISALNACRSWNEGMNDVLRAVMQLEGIDSGGIYSANPADNALTAITQCGLSAMFMTHVAYIPGTSKNAVLAAQGKPFYGKYDDFSTDKDRIRESEGLLAFAMIPIVTNGQLVVVLNVASHKVSSFPASTREALETIAAQIGLTLMRIRSETALRESEERFRTFMEQASEGFMLVDEKGCVCEWNAALSQITGYSYEEVIGKSWAVFIMGLFPPERKSKERAERIIHAVAETLELGTATHFIDSHSDSTIMTKTGKRITIQQATFLIKTSKGFRIGSAIRDITEAKKAEVALKTSEERFRQFSDNVSDGFWILDIATNKCVFANPALESMFNIDMTGRDFMEILMIIHPDDRERVFKEKTLAERNELEYRILRADKSERWIRSRQFQLKDETGKTIRIFGVSTDVTEYKKASIERELHRLQMIQADKMATLGILVSGVAHEINNPNNYLMLNSKIIGRVWRDVLPLIEKHAAGNPHFKLADLDFREAVTLLPDIIQGLFDGTMKIKRIVDSLRDYARNEPSDSKQKINLNKIVESSLVLLSNIIQKSTDHFATHPAPDLPAVIGSAQQLEQVVINLISNACQALTQRTQKIEVYTLVERGDILLKIVDEGAGISSENIGKIFDPFFTTKRESGGTGLGLPISNNIIRNHNGSIDFTSEEGKGTTVVVRLPGPNRLTVTRGKTP